MSNVQEELKVAIKLLDDFISAYSQNHDDGEILNNAKAALSEIEKCEPVAKLGRWMIDKSTGTDILTIDKCSVIEGKYAHYIMGLLQKEIDKVVSELENTSQQPIEKCEPVAYMNPNAKDTLGMLHWVKNEYYSQPLFTSPQPRDWVGLSDAEVNELSDLAYEKNYGDIELIRSSEAKLKQLNTKG